LNVEVGQELAAHFIPHGQKDTLNLDPSSLSTMHDRQPVTFTSR